MKIMANFNKAYAKTMREEGGYANNPADKGGETLNGISRKFWPNWQGWPLVDRIKLQVGTSAAAINKVVAADNILQRLIPLFYKENFWDVHGLDHITDQSIAEEIFDTGVNMSASVAARFLQEALNLCNRNEADYPNITVDGKIGPITRSVLQRANVAKVRKTMNLLQGERYLNILRNNETQEVFWGGWMNRVIC